jgi:hypothetical protein
MPTNVSAVADSFSAPNYVGELFLVGENRTPFLNMVGGLNGGGKQAGSFEFPISQEWNLDAGAQPAITETASLTAPSPRTFVRGQSDNTAQIFHRAVTVSYSKQSQAGALSGLNIEGSNEVRDELDFQIQANLKMVAKDSEYTFINGVYQKATDAGTAAKTRGMLSAITTNVVDNGAIARALTKTLLKDLVRTMADNGCPFDNPVIFASSAKIQAISELYENDFMEQDRNVGGVAIKQLIFDFVQAGIVWCPAMPADTIMIADMAHIAPVFVPVPGKGFLFYEELAKSGASEKGQLYGQIGLDHGVEQFHGKLVDLS